MTIPVLAGSRLFGQSIIALINENVTLEIISDTTIDVVESFNVICETDVPVKDHNTIVMAGSHLDGVPEGTQFISPHVKMNDHYRIIE
jgi:hypothetical protein